MQSEEETIILSSPDAVVHLEYEPKTLPSLQQVAAEYGGGSWTRFVCISDTHCKTFEVPDGDVLLHSGDLTKVGRTVEMKKTMEWIYGLPHKVKIVIAGNHDLPLHREWYEENWKRWAWSMKQDFDSVSEWLTGERAKASGVIYLENEKATFRLAPDRREWYEKLNFDSKWSPEYHNWAFNYQPEEAEG
ncbi:hypothetical protein EST38_g10167 [Candolleomyces aberdarensis]|uniref:Calcineurin-like phosphoesterase domain-containing protein n=1 Tax=Candolleomyces aberdarensis TaxID=2316362 RepID=A0A4Q2DBB7_9AGAR|nr:hypothetical protein EST38_g10167 [Candolleomyces aberdarensis]